MRVGTRLVFGLPKSDRDRYVPLPVTVARAIRAHLERWPPVAVTLPWEEPAGELVAVPMVFTSVYRNAVDRSKFDTRRWHPALRAAGLTPGRANGMHALRHFYASVLLDAGESIKALAEYLGHIDPGFTLRVYTHLMPSSEERTRHAIDNLFADEDHGLATA